MTLAHEALFYSTVDEFLEGTARFARDALAAGEPVLIAVAQPRLDLLRDLLRKQARFGAIEFVDMAKGGRNPNRILPWLLRSYVERHCDRRPHIIGEPIFVGRRPEELGPCVQHEALINVVFAERDTHLLCPYDVAHLGHVVPYAEQTHPVVRQNGVGRDSRGYTDPQTVVALLNQPLPEPERVDDTIAFDVRGLPGVRHLAATRAGLAGLDENRTGDLQLALTEVATNAVTHPCEGAATLRVWSQSDRYVCEVRGAGEIADIMAGRIVPGPDTPRGRGLLVANRLCDLVQTHTSPTGTVTRLTMWLP